MVANSQRFCIRFRSDEFPAQTKHHYLEDTVAMKLEILYFALQNYQLSSFGHLAIKSPLLYKRYP